MLGQHPCTYVSYMSHLTYKIPGMNIPGIYYIYLYEERYSQYLGVKSFREKILQVLGALLTDCTCDTSRFSTAGTSRLAVFRGSILLLVLPELQLFQRVLYCGYREYWQYFVRRCCEYLQYLNTLNMLSILGSIEVYSQHFRVQHSGNSEYCLYNKYTFNQK